MIDSGVFSGKNLGLRVDLSTSNSYYLEATSVVFVLWLSSMSECFGTFGFGSPEWKATLGPPESWRLERIALGRLVSLPIPYPMNMIDTAGDKTTSRRLSFSVMNPLVTADLLCFRMSTYKAQRGSVPDPSPLSSC